MNQPEKVNQSDPFLPTKMSAKKKQNKKTVFYSKSWLNECDKKCHEIWHHISSDCIEL